jgi:hypothetical protein
MVKGNACSAGLSMDRRQAEQGAEDQVPDRRNAQGGLNHRGGEGQQVVDRDEAREALPGAGEHHARGDQARAQRGHHEHDDVRLGHAGQIQRAALAVRGHHGDERIAQALRRGLQRERNEIGGEPPGGWSFCGVRHRGQDNLQPSVETCDRRNACQWRGVFCAP